MTPPPAKLKHLNPTTILLLTFSIALSMIITHQSQAADKASTLSTKSGSSEYIIGAGDILQIFTWKEPDFSRDEVHVRLDGKISFPLLDDVQAEGRTLSQLKNDIANRLKAFISNPNVTVSVRDSVSKKFYILGEVNNTGEYPLVKNLTVLQAFALAGGFTEWASKKEIILFRKVGGKDKVIRINYKKILKGDDFKDNVTILPDDTIIVP
jgi:polysaccharide biosynthesis/export protein